MAAKASFLEEELCCPVCCEIFKDPVLLECSHSFCRVCLQQWWGENSPRECPICRSKASSGHSPVNLALKNIVESYLKQKTECEAAETSEDQCPLHRKELLFFCEDDLQPLCIVCQTSKKHRNHQVCPMEEAVPDLKDGLMTALIHIKEKLEMYTEVTQKCEKTMKHIRQSQAQHTENQIKADFEKLHQFLRAEEETRLAALREEEEQKCQLMKEKIENFTQVITTLSDKIKAIDKSIEGEDAFFLKTYTDAKRRAQCTLQDPELLSGALIDVAKHLGNLKFRVWEKMLEMVQYTPVILDPNTMCPRVCLSDDLTCVRFSEVKQQIPENPERFSCGVMVLGSDGFTSGKHSWEVEVGEKPTWTIGVVQESINRKEVISCNPGSGFWVLGVRDGDDYIASGGAALKLERKPQRIRVELDYDRGEVSFFDPSDMSHIYTFKGTFTEKIFPYVNPYQNDDGRNGGVLQICPLSVRVMKSQ
ncbi:zinc-binding protein A33-like isoform X1 [Anguilla anguilla]|uniref:zinc-binding protein A33-like isoform X1 n=1 Tax=Anguilla anguilla TaxID=7936 RepID=UPI0015B293CA|nr:zinc-binding protein A33-like isoform X1 [Anguilla anguilla]